MMPMRAGVGGPRRPIFWGSMHESDRIGAASVHERDRARAGSVYEGNRTNLGSVFKATDPYGVTRQGIEAHIHGHLIVVVSVVFRAVVDAPVLLMRSIWSCKNRIRSGAEVVGT